MKPLRFMLPFTVLVLMVAITSSLSAQHFSLTMHTNAIPQVVDFSNQNLMLPAQQTLGFDMRIFSGENWAFRGGVVLNGQDVWGHEDYDYDWDEFDFDEFEWEIEEGMEDFDFDPGDIHDQIVLEGDYCPSRNLTVVGELGLERHIFLFDEKLDIYPGLYLPLVFSDDEKATAEYIQSGEILRNAGVVLGTSVRLLRIFRLGVEFDAGFSDTSTAIKQSFRETSFTPMKRIPYQTALTLGLAF